MARRVLMVAFPGAQILDVVGPLEVFACASSAVAAGPGAGRGPAYEVEVAALAAGPVRMSSGVCVVAERALRDVRGPLDTLIVAGGEGVAAAAREPALLRRLRALAPVAQRLASVCTGTFLLAEAGLLDGRRVTTHWAACDRLARLYPKLRVDPEPIFVRDGRLYTSAGVTAGMDLALALVEEDHGRATALAVARRLVLFLKRPGGQAQFSAWLSAQQAEREPLREVVAWILASPAADLCVATLAARAAMSPRHFARVFAAQVGATPARFVERARVEAARRLLEETDRGVEDVAAACGFGSAETLRRAFLRSVRVNPADYRRRFRREAPPVQAGVQP
jgi:transcriptional regulator GlxA family with amidase domain